MYFSQESNTYNSLKSVAYEMGIKTPHHQWAGSLKNQLIYGIEKVGRQSSQLSNIFTGSFSRVFMDRSRLRNSSAIDERGLLLLYTM